jgi:hypothetical protein
MKITLSFTVDKDLLEIAIKSCIYEGIKPNVKNVKLAIQSTIRQKGLDAVSFPELWGDDLADYDYPQYKIEEIASNLHGRIN